jgi:hypothetical protein
VRSENKLSRINLHFGDAKKKALQLSGKTVSVKGKGLQTILKIWQTICYCKDEQ